MSMGGKYNGAADVARQASQILQGEATPFLESYVRSLSQPSSLLSRTAQTNLMMSKRGRGGARIYKTYVLHPGSSLLASGASAGFMFISWRVAFSFMVSLSETIS